VVATFYETIKFVAGQIQEPPEVCTSKNSEKGVYSNHKLTTDIPKAQPNNSSVNYADVV
jgi:hypothetical protein